MFRSAQTFHCRRFLESYQKQLAHDILELDLHCEEVQRSLFIITHGDVTDSIVQHLQDLHRRVTRLTAKQRYLEGVADTLESAARLLFPGPVNIPTPDIAAVIAKLPSHIDHYRIDGELISSGLDSILQDLHSLRCEYSAWLVEHS